MTMVPDQLWVTHREFDQHIADYRNLEQQVRFLDEHGTRGVTEVRSTVQAVRDDVSDLKAEFARHEGKHEAELFRAEAAAQAAHRFRVTASIAAGGLGISTIGLLIDLVIKAHGA